ncbi:hypothetical protein NDU88_000934 [Pleurodeles waltl]|uniref:Uncharacterized protein n=1 Tax=Pleurodeles waltl TaxID=8319 RepID=A0AAV7MJH1_PLEWA|nr:hypothetical protein NDU88_000934 [Pleurodeles waltl]
MWPWDRHDAPHLFAFCFRNFPVPEAAVPGCSAAFGGSCRGIGTRTGREVSGSFLSRNRQKMALGGSSTVGELVWCRPRAPAAWQPLEGAWQVFTCAFLGDARNVMSGASLVGSKLPVVGVYFGGSFMAIPWAFLMGTQGVTCALLGEGQAGVPGNPWESGLCTEGCFALSWTLGQGHGAGRECRSRLSQHCTGSQAACG